MDRRRRAHSKMGVYKKLKRVFSFKKDKEGHKEGQKESTKKDKNGKRYGTNEMLPANGSLGRGSSDVDVVKTDTLHKDGKKRSWSLRSLARKPSFGRKDKDKRHKEDKDVSPHSSHDTSLEPALLSGVIAPAPSVTMQQQQQPPPPPQRQVQEQKSSTTTRAVEYTTVTVECTAPPPPPPPPLPPYVVPPYGESEREGDEVDSGTGNKDAATKEEDIKTEDFVVVTPAVVKEIEEYEAQLAAEGRSVCVNEVEGIASPASDNRQPEELETHADATPHTIAEVINMLVEKQERATHAADSATADASDNGKSACPQTDTVDSTSTSAANPTAVIPTATPAEAAVTQSNGVENGHVKTGNGSALPAAAKTSPSYKPTATAVPSKQIETVPTVKLWRFWLSITILVIGLAVAAILGMGSSMTPGAIRTD